MISELSELDEITEETFEEFGFCSCGSPWVVMDKIFEILDNVDEDGFIKYSTADENAIYMYLLDKYGYVEHYTSIYASKPTQKGKDFVEKCKKAAEKGKNDRN